MTINTVWRRVNPTLWGIAAAVTVSVALPSCKPKAGSSTTKDVDRIIGQSSGIQNDCGPSDLAHLASTPLAGRYAQIQSRLDSVLNVSTPALADSDNKDLTTGQKSQLARVLMAAPDPLLNKFLAVGHLYFGAPTKVQNKCKEIIQRFAGKLSDPVKPLTTQAPLENSCWGLADDNNLDTPVIYLAYNQSDEKMSFAHAMLLRMLAYVYTEDFVNQGKLTGDEEFTEFEAAKTSLANGFRQDLDQFPSARDGYIKTLGSQFETLQEFKNYVFAEVVDSVYCSKSTYQVFDQGNANSPFKASFKAFNDIGFIQLYGQPWFKNNVP